MSRKRKAKSPAAVISQTSWSRDKMQQYGLAVSAVLTRVAQTKPGSGVPDLITDVDMEYLREGIRNLIVMRLALDVDSIRCVLFLGDNIKLNTE